LNVFTPKDPEFEPRIRACFAKLGLLKTLGAHLTRVSPGAVEVELPLSRRRTTVTQADVFAETAGQEKLLGLVTATFINGTAREEI
jgi:hypothetical protein